jgi:hypothetical protein
MQTLAEGQQPMPAALGGPHFGQTCHLADVLLTAACYYPSKLRVRLDGQRRSRRWMQVGCEDVRMVTLDDVSLGGKSLLSVVRTASPDARRMGVMLVDALIVLESFVLAMLFRFDAVAPKVFWESFLPFAALSVPVFSTPLPDGSVQERLTLCVSLGVKASQWKEIEA